MNNFLSVYGIYNPPVARETRVKWGIYGNRHVSVLSCKIEKIHENMLFSCFQESTKTCTYVFISFLHLVPTFPLLYHSEAQNT